MQRRFATRALSVAIGWASVSGVWAQPAPAPSPWNWMSSHRAEGAAEPPKPSADAFASPPADAPRGSAVAPHRAPPSAAPPAADTLKPFVLRQTTCNIPFTVDSAKDPAPELQLYVSQDQGKNWKFYSKAVPTAGHFTFRALSDGEYWFSLRSIEKGTPAPDVSKLTPGLKVMFDTRDPELQFTARLLDNGEVSTTWKAKDPTLHPETLKVEYQTSPQSLWQPVVLPPSRQEADGSISGNYAWNPKKVGDHVLVRAEISDQAGNKAVVSRKLLIGQAVGSQSTDDFRSRPASDTVTHPVAHGGQSWPVSNELPAAPPAAPVASHGDLPAPQPTSPATPSRSGTSPAATSAPRGPVTKQVNGDGSATRFNHPLPPSPVPPASPQYPVQELPPQIEEEIPVYQPQATYPAQPSSESTPAAPSYPAPAPSYVPPPSHNPPAEETPAPTTMITPQLPHGERPRMTNSRQFSLDYEIDALGPSGLAKVELWGTSDGGRTWTHWQDDADQVSPLDVVVNQDGIFGFRIVITGSNQLTSAKPRPGDPADLWVGVDTSQPTVRITAAIYGEGENAGKLDVRWQAHDLWFSDRPITLQFSEQPSGPWITIAAGLPNSGQYLWTVDPRIPRMIYLRIEGRDEAGNSAEHQITEAINTAGLIPQGRIRGLRANVTPGAEDRSAARASGRR